MSSPRNTTTPAGADAEYSRAVAWLREVDGRLMRKRDDPDGPEGWVAIVKTPAPAARPAQLILGFGESPVAAVSTARDAWQTAWREISTVH